MLLLTYPYIPVNIYVLNRLEVKEEKIWTSFYIFPTKWEISMSAVVDMALVATSAPICTCYLGKLDKRKKVTSRYGTILYT